MVKQNNEDRKRVIIVQQTLDQMLAHADRTIKKLKEGEIKPTRRAIRDALLCCYRMFHPVPMPVGSLSIKPDGTIGVGPELDDLMDQNKKFLILMLHHLLAHIIFNVEPDDLHDPIRQTAICAYAQISTCFVRNETAKEMGLISLKDIELEPSRKCLPFLDAYEAAMYMHESVLAPSCVRSGPTSRWSMIESGVAQVLADVREAVPDAFNQCWFACAWDEHRLNQKIKGMSTDELAAFIESLMISLDGQSGGNTHVVSYYIGCSACPICTYFKQRFERPITEPNLYHNIALISDKVEIETSVDEDIQVCGTDVPLNRNATNIVFVTSCEQVKWPEHSPKLNLDGRKVKLICMRLVSKPSRGPDYVISVNWRVA